MTVDALAFVGYHDTAFFVEFVYAVGALLFAYLAVDASRRVSYYFIDRIYIVDRHYYLFSFLSKVTITGSPPLGAHILSGFGSITLIAHSSLAI